MKLLDHGESRAILDFGCALEMMRASQLPGKNKAAYHQFDTIRKLFTLHSNFFEISSRDSGTRLALRCQRGQSRFFTRFTKGLLERAGRCVESDMVLDHRILQKILENV